MIREAQPLAHISLHALGTRKLLGFRVWGIASSLTLDTVPQTLRTFSSRLWVKIMTKHFHISRDPCIRPKTKAKNKSGELFESSNLDMAYFGQGFHACTHRVVPWVLGSFKRTQGDWTTLPHIRAIIRPYWENLLGVPP